MTASRLAGALDVEATRWRRAIRRRPLLAFFALSVAVSWSYWIPLAVSGAAWSHFPGLLGPMVAAFIVSAVCRGSTGFGDLIRRMARWHVPLRWYAASGMLLALGLLAVGVETWVNGESPALEPLSSMPGLPDAGWVGVFVMVLVINGYGEETGWRGFAWPELRQRHSTRDAAALLAVPWAIWHLPTFWLETGQQGLSPYLIPGWLIGLMCGAVVLGWMYDNARHSVPIVALFHATLNMVSATEAAEGFPAVVVTIAVIGAAVAILRGEHASAAPSRGARSPDPAP